MMTLFYPSTLLLYDPYSMKIHHVALKHMAWRSKYTYQFVHKGQVCRPLDVCERVCKMLTFMHELVGVFGRPLDVCERVCKMTGLTRIYKSVIRDKNRDRGEYVSGVRLVCTLGSGTRGFVLSCTSFLLLQSKLHHHVRFVAMDVHIRASSSYDMRKIAFSELPRTFFFSGFRVFKTTSF